MQSKACMLPTTRYSLSYPRYVDRLALDISTINFNAINYEYLKQFVITISAISAEQY